MPSAPRMSMPRLGGQLGDHGLQELADVGHRRVAARRQLRLGPLAVPPAELHEGVEPGEVLADVRVVVAAARPGQLHQVGQADHDVGRPASRSRAASPARRPRNPPFGPGYRPVGVGAAAQPRPLEEQRRLRDLPAVALAADQVGVVADGVVEEHLVEHGLAGHLPQRADGDARLVEREGEPRDAGVLRHRRSRCGPAASRSRPASAMLLQTFWPLMTQRSPSRSARVVSPARSEPAPGSLKSWHQLTAPPRIGVTSRAIWSGVPWVRIVGAAMSIPSPPGGRRAPRSVKAARTVLIDGAVQAAPALVGGEVGCGPAGLRPRAATSRRRTARGPSSRRARPGPRRGARRCVGSLVTTAPPRRISRPRGCAEVSLSDHVQ